MQEDNIEKIRALMAKTIQNGATENEAMQAMTLAKKLMSKHGITMDDVKNKNIKASDFIWGSNATKQETYVSKFEMILTRIISDYTNTKSINFYYNIGNNNGKRVKRNSRVMFFGHKVDVELAVYMLNVCNAALEREWALYRASQIQKIHGNRIKNFSIGMAARIYQRIEALMEEEIKSTGTDLIVMKNAIVESLYEAAIEGTSPMKSSGGLIKYDNDDSLEKGFEAGDKVNIHKSFSDKKTVKLGKE